MPSKALAKAGLSKEKYDRCVDKVKSSGSGKNAYAICTAGFNRKFFGRKKKPRSM